MHHVSVPRVAMADQHKRIWLQAIQTQQLDDSATLCEMTQPAKQYQDLLKQLRGNVDQDLALYLNMMDQCWKKVSIASSSAQREH